MHSTTSSTTTEPKAGTNTLSVANGAAFTVGQKITVPLYNARLWTTTITGISENNLTLADKTPGLIRTSSIVTVTTTPTIPSTDLGYGAANGAVALLGGPVDVVPAYGYGGAICIQMMADLERDLRHYRPHYVALHMYENDMTRTVASGGATIEQMIGWGRAMCRLCLSYGAVPLLYSSMPYYKAAGPIGIPTSRAADYDALADYVGSGQNGQLSRDVPGAWGDNSVSTGWLDPAYINDASYSRRPLAGWTDGVHPNNNKRFGVGLIALPVLQQMLPPAASWLDLASTPLSITRLEGTGGTATNLVGGSVVPKSHTIAAAGTTVCTTSRNADGSLKVVGSWPNAANFASDYIQGFYTFVFPTVWPGSTQRFKGFMKLRINSMVGMSNANVTATLDTGEAHVSMSASDVLDSMPADGRIIVLETPVFALGFGALNVKPGFVIRPATAASPANAAIDIDVLEIGIVPAISETPHSFI